MSLCGTLPDHRSAPFLVGYKPQMNLRAAYPAFFISVSLMTV